MSNDTCNIKTDMNDKRVDSWSILVKPTHACNLDCQYCYDKPHRDKYGDVKMSFEMIRHLLDLISEHTQFVQWIWHGGEPTLMGIEWYEKVQDIFYEYHDKLEIDQSMQSNGTLLNKEWAMLSQKYDISMGVSYDAFGQELRLNDTTYKVEDSIDEYIEAGGKVGIISVINKNNYSKMKKMYEYFKSRELPASFNHIYHTEQAEKHNLELDASDYAESFKDFFDFWIDDSSKDAIDERKASVIMDKVLGTGERRICNFGDCRYGWIGVNPVGEIHPCDRKLPDKYDMGNIMNYSSISEIYEKSDGHKLYAIETQKRFLTHCDDCGYFDYCQGGCNANHITVAGNASGVDENTCEIFRQEFNIIYDKLRSIDIYEDDVNRFLKYVLVDNNLFFIKEIKDFLKEKGLGQYLDLQYSNDGKKLLNSQEFKLFRIFNPYRMFNARTQHQDYSPIQNNINVNVDYDFDFYEIKDERLEILEKIFRMHKSKIYEVLLEGKE